MNNVIVLYYVGLIIFLLNFPILMAIKAKSREVSEKMDKANKLLMRIKLRGRR